MSHCLYCQCANPQSAIDCHNCGMLLPTDARHNKHRRERRFVWFCAALTVFCLGMAIWLPRALF